MKKIGFIIFLFICLLSMACSGCRNRNNLGDSNSKSSQSTTGSIQESNDSNQLNKIKVSIDSVKDSVKAQSKTIEDIQDSIVYLKDISVVSLILNIVLLVLVGILVFLRLRGKRKNNSSPNDISSGTEDSEETEKRESNSDRLMCNQQDEKQFIINKIPEYFSSLKNMIERLTVRVDNIEKVMEQRSRQPENPTSLPKTSGSSPQIIYAQKDADQNNILRECKEGLYKIILSGNEQNKGELHINQNPGLMKQALDDKSYYIDGICEIKNRGTGNTIKEENPGTVRKKNGVWVVETCVEISIE